jgi:hypothetical protein
MGLSILSFQVADTPRRADAGSWAFQFGEMSRSASSTNSTLSVAGPTRLVPQRILECRSRVLLAQEEVDRLGVAELDDSISDLRARQAARIRRRGRQTE